MRVLAGCLVILTACGGGTGDSGPQPLDAGTSGPGDAASSVSGLTVTWAAAPGVPGMVRDGVVVTSATFRVRRLEVIGDAGPGGTTGADIRLEWSETAQPLPITFASAAPGLYSKVTLDIDGDLAGPSYELQGLIEDGGGGMAPFRIVDRGDIEVDIDGYEIGLGAGFHAQVPIRLDLGEVFADLTIAHFHDEAGVWTLDDADSYILELREDLERAFRRGL